MDRSEADLMTPSSDVSPGPVTDLVTMSGMGGLTTLRSLISTWAASLITVSLDPTVSRLGTSSVPDDQ